MRPQQVVARRACGPSARAFLFFDLEETIMNPDSIRRWRPCRFGDFVGERNRQAVCRVQRALLTGRAPSPLLGISPFGYGKTSFFRHLIRAVACEHRDPMTADPCFACQQCKYQGPLYSGFGSPRRFEIDCTRIDRRELIELIQDNYFDPDVLFFFDEIHHLHERHAQETLLKFLEDSPGLIFAALMQDRYQEMIPPLRERFEKIYLGPPEEHEMVVFYAARAEEWVIRADEETLRLMVRHSSRSFRTCQKILAAAAETATRTLTRVILAEFLDLNDRGTKRNQAVDDD